MQIEQDPITKLYCREDGAILMPPCHNIHRFTHTWTFGSKQSSGYHSIRYRGKAYQVHILICRAFHGLPPAGKPFVDHINREKSANFASNLRWVSAKENCNNKDYVDKSIEKFGVRHRDDPRAYNKARNKAYWASKYAEKKAQGLIWKKGPDGKWGWHPRVRPVKESALCLS